jgi:serralysin
LNRSPLRARVLAILAALSAVVAVMTARLAPPAPHAAHACVDVRPPTPRTPSGVEDLAALDGSYWPVGHTLHVAFRGGTPSLNARVLAQMQEWSKYVAIDFAAGDWSTAEVRVAYLQGQGSYSYLGTGCLQVPADQHTMNLGWLDDATDPTEVRRVVLHETGHALGFVHEQSQPNANIPWNKPAVYAFYAGPPNYWDKAEVDAQVFQRYSTDEVTASPFDPASIMEYPVDARLTTKGYAIGWNTDLTDTDKAFAASIYPGRYHAVTTTDPPPRPDPLPDGSVAVSIDATAAESDVAGIFGVAVFILDVPPLGATYRVAAATSPGASLVPAVECAEPGGPPVAVALARGDAGGVGDVTLPAGRATFTVHRARPSLAFKAWLKVSSKP